MTVQFAKRVVLAILHNINTASSCLGIQLGLQPQRTTHVRYEHPAIASLLIGVVQEADLVSPGFEQSTVISNHSTLDFTLHYDEQRIVLPGGASWKRLCSSSVPPDDDDEITQVNMD